MRCYWQFRFPAKQKTLYGPEHQRHGYTALVLIRKARVSLQLFSHPPHSQSQELKDMNNQRPAQARPVMDFSPGSRQPMVNKIMDKLKRHVPVSRPVELNELRKAAERFENKIYCTSRGQHEYLRKISLKMLELETKSFNAAINSLPSSSAAHGREPLRPRL